MKMQSLSNLVAMMISIPLIAAAIGCSSPKSIPLASTQVPVPAPTPVPTPLTTRAIKNFAIYYGWPNSLNSATLEWNNGSVANFFKQYSLVVFGAGLELDTHPDHANLLAIAAAMKGHTEVFGYVSIGSTDSFSMATIESRIDNWKNLVGADGIFFDEFGFDFKLAGYTDAQMRQRQKDAVSYAHSKGLKVFVNAWDSDDVFVKESGNPISWSAGDKYLYESYVFSWATRETFANYRAKIAKLQAASAQTGVELYAVSTTAAPDSDFSQSNYDYLALSAAADGLHGISWGTVSFSSGTATMPFRTNTNLLTAYSGISPLIDTTSESITTNHPSGTYLLNYNNATFATQ